MTTELKTKADDPIFISNNISKVIWSNRCRDGKKTDIYCLSLGRARILHMPGELFVEYQLAAKAERPDLFVTMAAYGEYGPGYICTDIAYQQGGYEAGDASGVAVGSEKILMTCHKKSSPQIAYHLYLLFLGLINFWNIFREPLLISPEMKKKSRL